MIEKVRGPIQWPMDDKGLLDFADVWRGEGDQIWGGVTTPGASPPTTRARGRFVAMQLYFAGPAPGTDYYIGPPPDKEIWIFRGMSWWLAHALNPMNSFDVQLLTLGRSIGGGFPGPYVVDVPALQPDFSIALSPSIGSYLSPNPFTLVAGTSYAFPAVGGALPMIRRATVAATGRQSDAIRIHGHGDGVNAAMLQVVMEIDRYKYDPPNPTPRAF